MGSIVVLAIGVAILLAVACWRFIVRSAAHARLRQYCDWHEQASHQPYKARQFLLSKAELAFYRELRSAVGGDYLICVKPRLADLVTCDDVAWRNGYGRLVAQKHVDFALCDPQTTRIIAAIELDDQSHAYAKSQARDAFVNQLFDQVEVPLLRIRAARMYDPSRLRAMLMSLRVPDQYLHA